MIQRVYSIRDKVARECGPLFVAKNDGVALRQFRNLLKTDGVRPDDFELLLLGMFDTDGSCLTSYTNYTVIDIPTEVEVVQ